MLTRLRVTGFKNLVDVDVRFGPFTCIAGLNGVGKSNLFDAILLLSALSEKTLLESITGVRGETIAADASRVFTAGRDYRAEEISIEADLIISPRGRDDLDQEAEAKSTYATYGVTLRVEPGAQGSPRIALTREILEAHTKTDARKALYFARRNDEWLDSVLEKTSPRSSQRQLISTEQTPDGARIHVHQEGHQGRTRPHRADGLVRTVLSTFNTAAEHPTGFLVCRELRSWRMLQLEPAHLRAPSGLLTPARVEADGRGLAAALHRLIHGPAADSESVRARLSNRIAELVEDVRTIEVDRDDARQALTVVAEDRDGIRLRARDLSDGTLRFLALTVLEMDPTWGGLLCMEEPENGIHPTRIPAMLRLLQDVAVDPDFPVGDDNPLRQVIVNTHSPEIAALVPDDALLFAEPRAIAVGDAGLVRGIVFPAALVDVARSRQRDRARESRASPGVPACYRGGAVGPRARGASGQVGRGAARGAATRGAATRARLREPGRMRAFCGTLVTDGTSDRVLLPILRWLLTELGLRAPALTWADPATFPRGATTLDRRLEAASSNFPCDVLFVHRDAETEPRAARVMEIERAAADRAHVAVVPVRMTEAWFLFDEAAIRFAANNPRGTMPLQLPALRDVERRSNPKAILDEAIRIATGATGRKLAKIDPRRQVRLLADRIESFAPLRELSAFRALEEDLRAVLREGGWHLER